MISLDAEAKADLEEVVTDLYRDMRGQTGSVTLHFKEGLVETTEYRIFKRRLRRKKAA